MKNIITLGFLLICFSAIGQIKPYQIESDSVRRMVMMSDTVNEGGTQYNEIVWESIDSLVRQITKDTLKMDSAFWEVSGSKSLVQKSNNSNIILGQSAGASATGSRIIAIGQSAGSSSSGSDNIFIGYLSGLFNSSGNNNSFFGYQSGFFNTTGSNNFFSGLQAGYANSTGSNNYYVGSYAGLFQTGNQNSMIGYQSGRGSSGVSTGGNNVYIAYRSGYSSQSGGSNLALGVFSLKSTTTGFRNVAIGYNAGSFNTTGYDNVMIGYQAGYNETGSNKLYIDNSNTATPLIYGDFSTDALTVNGTLSVTSKSGTATNVASWDGDKIIDSGTSIASLANADAVDSMNLRDFSTNVSWVYEGLTSAGVQRGDPLIIAEGTDINITRSSNVLTFNSTATGTDDQALSYTPSTGILTLEDGGASSQMPMIISSIGPTGNAIYPYTTNTDIWIRSELIDFDGDDGSSGQVLSSTGSSTNWITLPDGSSSNELQTISKSGSNVTLSNGGGTVSINDSDFSTTNELQTLSVSGTNLSISSGNTVAIPSVAPDPDIAYAYSATTVNNSSATDSRIDINTTGSSRTIANGCTVSTGSDFFDCGAAGYYKITITGGNYSAAGVVGQVSIKENGVSRAFAIVENATGQNGGSFSLNIIEDVAANADISFEFLSVNGSSTVSLDEIHMTMEFIK